MTDDAARQPAVARRSVSNNNIGELDRDELSEALVRPVHEHEDDVGGLEGRVRAQQLLLERAQAGRVHRTASERERACRTRAQTVSRLGPRSSRAQTR